MSALAWLGVVSVLLAYAAVVTFLLWVVTGAVQELEAENRKLKAQRHPGTRPLR